MRLLLQRVSEASVSVEGVEVGSIGSGLLIFLGIHKDDDRDAIAPLIKKALDLRIFEDSEGSFNLSLKDVRGSVLIVSQFTLYADCRKGRRPAFIDAMPPTDAKKLYESFIEAAVCKLGEKRVARGAFGAHMKVSLINDGPVTISLSND